MELIPHHLAEVSQFPNEILECFKRGGFSVSISGTAWSNVALDEAHQPQPLPSFNTNAQEADIIIWKHVKQCSSTKMLIYSPDSDIYNIGLGLFEELSKDIVIQINPISKDNKFLHLQQLISCLHKDPDLAPVKDDSINRIMQTLFISSGCDYISYVRSIGKNTFLDVFFQHSNFINGSHMRGCLSQTYPANNMEGYLSFIRLIGTCYFKKYLSTFSCRYDCQTPDHLFNSLDSSLTIERKHKEWLNTIRSVVSTLISTEEERVPSITSLKLHWKRSCWVSMMCMDFFICI